jgi:2-succinyl-5-enolpyruvyl-6-hydroxy-3-cyclohexene-1-carboxylate synthase
MTTAGAIAATFCSALVDEWVKAGVRHAIVAPGSRSTPLALALMRENSIGVEIFHDERSAGFAALGVAMSTGVPAVVLCSSGTAGAHFYAAVIEAHLSNVPMIVCTADRPPHLRDISSPQTIDQVKMFGDVVRWFHDPGVPVVENSATWRALASRIFFTAIGARPGPVHLNLPFEEPLFGDALALPKARQNTWSHRVVASNFTTAQVDLFTEICSDRTGVFVAGKGTPSEILNLAASMGWPVLADSRSGVRHVHDNAIFAFDPILRTEEFAAQTCPQVVVFVGEPPASKVLSQWVRQTGAIIVHLGSTDAVVDPMHLVSHFFVGNLDQLCAQLMKSCVKTDPSWLLGWKKVDLAARATIDAWVRENWSEIAIAHGVGESLFAGSQCVVSSSMPIRDMEWFSGSMNGAVVHANRGANGIDGVVSTAVGVALGSGSPTFLLIGDVACIHDSNGLWGLNRRDVDLRIVVTNNDGGAIFSFLPQAQHVEPEVFETIYGTPHGVSLKALSQAHHIEYCEVSSSEELTAALKRCGPILIEARCERAVDVEQHNQLNDLVIASVKKAMA